jgi:hypothetical protein
MITDFIDPQDARWKKLLDHTKHDCYHLPEYVELAGAQEGATPMAFYAEDGEATCLIPLLIRPVPAALNAPANWVDCVSPYGYSGILMSASQNRLHSFLDAFQCTARERGIVTAFLRLHPLFPLDPVVLGKFGQLIRHGKTVSIDLSESTEAIWRGVSPNHRRNISKLQRSGFHGALDDWNRYSDFIAIYHSTMRRVGAAEAYFFTPRYFEALRDKLGPRLHLVSVMSESDELSAAGLFIETEGIVQYHLGGTAERYLHVAPTKFMIDLVWRWAKDQACTTVHLGGGVGGVEDSLFQFKARFSPHRGEFFTYRLVVDEAKHATLNQAAEAVRGAELAPTLEFFPAYRRLSFAPERADTTDSPTFSGL